MKVSRVLVRSAVSAALGGFLFGFDTVVISGAEQAIQELWNLSDAQHGLAVSMALWGTVLGSFVGGWPTDRFGRKTTLLWIGILFFVSAVWSGLATDVTSFMIARFIGGLGVGISTVAAPLYISEISPARLRGRLAGMFQFNIVFGILIAFFSNAMLEGVSENDWRWMLGIEAIPALLYSLFCLAIPESPRWLIGEREDRDSALTVLKELNPDLPVSELNEAIENIDRDAKSEASHSGFWSSKLAIPISLALLVAFFNQASGINAVLYFAPRIFGLTGLDEKAAMLQSVGVGFTNLIFTFVGLYLIDRLGRRTLLIVGSIGYILSLGTIGFTFLKFSPQFDVAAQALSLKHTAESVEQSDALGLSEEAIAGLRKQLEEEREALLQAVRQEDYNGPEPSINQVSSASEIKVRAEEVLVQASERSGVAGTIVLLGVFAFIAAHAVGQGAVIWVLISEIFPNHYRASGQALGSFTHWICAALLTTFFPSMVTAFAPGYVFLSFCGMMVLQLLWVQFMVPETKGVPLEKIQEQLGIE